MVEAFEGFPQSIKVGPFRYAIEVVDDLSKEDGETSWGDCESLRIRLKRAQPSPAFALDTALHEIGHAIAAAFTLGDKSDEERAVSVFATGWTMVLRENPALMIWIEEIARADV